MAIKDIPGGGGTVITGKEDINLFRLMALRGALRLEIQTGLRHSGGSVAARVKREFGFTGNKAAVYTKLDAMIEALGKDRLKTVVTGERTIN